MADRRPSICTASGIEIYPLHPDQNPLEHFQIRDIAHALSQTCRFSAHTKFHYSVAQHSFYVYNYVRGISPLNKELLRAALLHDAAEAYLGDWPSPLKSQPEMEELRRVEDELQERLGERFVFHNDHALVKEADWQVYLLEARQLMPKPQWWDLPDLSKNAEHLVPKRIFEWTPRAAYAHFLDAWEQVKP